MKTCLGMQVEQSTRSIKIHLDHYIKEVVAGYVDSSYIRKAIRPKKVPIAPNVVLRPEDTPDLQDPCKQKFYSSFVAKLQFAATWVRFNIAFAVSQLARFCSSAGPSHWAAPHHLMEYLAGTPSFKITYRRSKDRSNLLSGHANADWGNSCSLQSTSGTLMLYNKAPIMWKLKMQKATALSTAEAKYYSACTAGTEILVQVLRSSISEPFWNNSVSLRRRPHQCTRTAQRASSGATTSSEDVNEPSTLISASTLLMK